MDSQETDSRVQHSEVAEKKLPQQSGNFVWYLLGLGVLLLLMVTIFNSRNETRIPDERLREAGRGQQSQDASGQAQSGSSISRTARAQQTARGSALRICRDIIIGDSEVHGQRRREHG